MSEYFFHYSAHAIHVIYIAFANILEEVVPYQYSELMFPSFSLITSYHCINI